MEEKSGNISTSIENELSIFGSIFAQNYKELPKNLKIEGKTIYEWNNFLEVQIPADPDLMGLREVMAKSINLYSYISSVCAKIKSLSFTLEYQSFVITNVVTEEGERESKTQAQIKRDINSKQYRHKTLRKMSDIFLKFFEQHLDKLNKISTVSNNMQMSLLSEKRSCEQY